MKKILPLLLCFITLHLHAQTFTNYTEADGLINNAVLCLTVDANDNMWFGTQEGISFFDGTTWSNYNTTTHPDLVNNTIKAIAVDSDNNLWVGTDFGINKFDGTTWTTYTTADGLADNRIKYINQGADGKMWFANSDGISILDGTTWTSYVMADGIPFGGTNFVTFDAAGNTWLGTPLAGVLIFDGTNFTTISEDEGLLSDKVRSIAISNTQKKWIGTADGISVFDANNNFVSHHEAIFELPPPDELSPIEDVQIDSYGRVWVGVYVDYLVTEGGISLYETFEWSDYNVADGLVGPVVRRLDIDSQDNIWVATSTGVTKLGDVPVTTFDITVNSAINIFPNPTLSNFTIQVPEELVGSDFKIFNQLGMEVAQGNIPSLSFDFNAERLASGIYYLSIGEVYNKKIVLGE